MFGGRTSLIVNIFQPNFQGVSSIQIYIDCRVMITVITLGCWDHFSQAYRSQTRWDWLKRDFPFALEVDFSDVWNLFLEQYYPYWPFNGQWSSKVSQSLQLNVSTHFKTLCLLFRLPYVEFRKHTLLVMMKL